MSLRARAVSAAGARGRRDGTEVGIGSDPLDPNDAGCVHDLVQLESRSRVAVIDAPGASAPMRYDTAEPDPSGQASGASGVGYAVMGDDPGDGIVFDLSPTPGAYRLAVRYASDVAGARSLEVAEGGSALGSSPCRAPARATPGRRSRSGCR